MNRKRKSVQPLQTDARKITPKELAAILADYESRDGDPMDTDNSRVAAVKRAIARLSKGERTVFVLHIDGVSFRELSKMLNVSRETIRRYYEKTLENIRKELESWKQ